MGTIPQAGKAPAAEQRKSPKAPKGTPYNMHNPNMLTLAQAAQYLGIAKSTLYHLTAAKRIPYYKPMGQMCYFLREELDAFLSKNRVATAEELQDAAVEHCAKR